MLTADGSIIESGTTDGEGKISMTMHAFPQEIRELIFNEIYNEAGVYSEERGKQNNYVAVWFKRERRDGSYQQVGLTKVMFVDPNLEGKLPKKIGNSVQKNQKVLQCTVSADGKRKILFDSSREGADVDSFFQELLNGAYDSKTEVDTDDSTTGESVSQA